MITTMISKNYANWYDEPMWQTNYLNIHFPTKKKHPQREYHRSLRKVG